MFAGRRAAERRLERGGRDQRAAGVVVDDLGDDVAVRAEHGQPRTLGGAGDVLADPAVAADAAVLRFCFACRSSSLLAGLAGLAADTFAGVAHALALVGLGLAQRADVGGDLADQLLVDARALDPGGRRDLEGDALGGLDDAPGGEKPSASSSSFVPLAVAR